MNYDAEYIRELTAARKANEVARALIKDHEATIVVQRAELDAHRVHAGLVVRDLEENMTRMNAYAASLEYQLAYVQQARDAVIRQAHHWKREYLYFKGQLTKAYAAHAETRAERDALRAELAALREMVEAR